MAFQKVINVTESTAKEINLFIDNGLHKPLVSVSSDSSINGKEDNINALR